MAEEKEKPLTREDVLRLIKEHRGTAKGLDLSGEVFEKGADLSDLFLWGIILNDAQLIRANFNGSNLDEAVMQRANLQYATFNPFESKPVSLQGVDLRGAYLKNAEFRGADLSAAQFQEDPEQSLRANLEETDFRDANLFGTNFKECYFYRTKLEGACAEGANITEARLGDADWGNYVIGEEKKKIFDIAEHRYRQLKIWYAESGYYDIAGEFFFREMEAKRKGVKWWPKFWHRGWLGFVAFICGYGERPLRVIGWAASVVLGSALIYFIIGSVWKWWAFWNSLYFSAVSFTALGYGSWVETTNDWIRGIGAFESFIGVFTMALFLITFIRKMTR